MQTTYMQRCRTRTSISFSIYAKEAKKEVSRKTSSCGKEDCCAVSTPRLSGQDYSDPTRYHGPTDAPPPPKPEPALTASGFICRVLSTVAEGFQHLLRNTEPFVINFKRKWLFAVLPKQLSKWLSSLACLVILHCPSTQKWRGQGDYLSDPLNRSTNTGRSQPALSLIYAWTILYCIQWCIVSV